MPLNQTLKKNSNVLWTISIIQDQTPDAQTKSEFAEMANDVLNTETIGRVTLCLADNLQRFRLMIQHGISEEEAIKECQKLAIQWHQDNAENLDKLKEGKKLSILTWEEFLAWPEYKQAIEDVERWYKENHKFRHDVDGRIRQELNRISNDAKIFDPTKQIELLKKYLFEEYAFQKFASTMRFNYEIYKNSWPPAMKDIKNNTNFVPPGFMTALHFTQFEQTPKKLLRERLPLNTPNVGIDFPPNYETKKITTYPADSSKFLPVFTKNSNGDANGLKFNEPSSSMKALEFIEKSLAVIPDNQREKAISALLKFMNQEIVPLCYTNNINTFKL